MKDIQFRTIQRINGLNRVYPFQVKYLQKSVCDELNVEHTEENYKEVEKGIEQYFKIQNK